MLFFLAVETEGNASCKAFEQVTPHLLSLGLGPLQISVAKAIANRPIDLTESVDWLLGSAPSGGS